MLGSPVKRPARRAQQAVPAAGLAVAVAAAALLLLLLLFWAAALRCALSAGALWTGGVSVAAEAASASPGKSDVDEEEEQCDLFDGGGGGGGYPLYSSADCPFLDVGFRCADNGRPDASYTKWRWQPSRCDLPRFASVASICCYLLPCFRRVPCPPSPESGDWFC